MHDTYQLMFRDNKFIYNLCTPLWQSIIKLVRFIHEDVRSIVFKSQPTMTMKKKQRQIMVVNGSFIQQVLKMPSTYHYAYNYILDL